MIKKSLLRMALWVSIVVFLGAANTAWANGYVENTDDETLLISITCKGFFGQFELRKGDRKAIPFFEGDTSRCMVQLGEQTVALTAENRFQIVDGRPEPF